MTETILQSEPTLRLSVFIGIFLLMALWELFAPRRTESISRWRRWPNNIGIVVVNTLILRVLVPSSAVGFAVLAAEQGWGLLNWFDVVGWLAVLLSVVLLDLAIYAQHVLFHMVPMFWRLHRMHHADIMLDVTSGARFHPVEILMSMGIKFLVIAALGPPAVAVLIFEVVLNASAMFNHANVSIPRGVDRVLRWVMVTPDMHRVHHSVIRTETDSNFGFNLPWWDRMFGTYQDQPAEGHIGMTIGLEQFRSIEDMRLDRMLLQPMRGDSDDSTAPE